MSKASARLSRARQAREASAGAGRPRGAAAAAAAPPDDEAEGAQRAEKRPRLAKRRRLQPPRSLETPTPPPRCALLQLLRRRARSLSRRTQLPASLQL